MIEVLRWERHTALRLASILAWLATTISPLGCSRDSPGSPQPEANARAVASDPTVTPSSSDTQVSEAASGRAPAASDASKALTPTASAVVPAPSPSSAPVESVSKPPPLESMIGKMVRIPAGTFLMGANNGEANEKPEHQVQVLSFELDLTEVTVRAFRECVRSGVCAQPDRGPQCNWSQPNKDDHPVNCVDWRQANAYCRWAKKRLPTEEEWEYAARGTDGRKYPWGQGEPAGRICSTVRRTIEFSLCVPAPDADECPPEQPKVTGTCAVGTFSSGDAPFGIHDLIGNVAEWTSSGYSDDYTKARSRSLMVNRGGSWSDGPTPMFRSFQGTDFRSAYIGFRCAR